MTDNVEVRDSRYVEMDDLSGPELIVALETSWKDLSLPATLWVRTAYINHVTISEHAAYSTNVKFVEIWPCLNHLVTHAIFTLTKGA